MVEQLKPFVKQNWSTLMISICAPLAVMFILNLGGLISGSHTHPDSSDNKAKVVTLEKQLERVVIEAKNADIEKQNKFDNLELKLELMEKQIARLDTKVQTLEQTLVARFDKLTELMIQFVSANK